MQRSNENDLRQALRGGQIAPEAVVVLLAKLAGALEKWRGHPDLRLRLRPENILLDASGEPVELKASLLLAPVEDDPGSIAGDERQEVFALGMIGLYVLGGGRLPRDLFANTGAFLARSNCGEALARAVSRAVALDPEDRFSSVSDFLEALRGAERRTELAPPEPAAAESPAVDPVEKCRPRTASEAWSAEPYRALYDIYTERGEWDKAWCAAGALTFLDQAGEHHALFYQRYRQRGPIRPRSALNEERWVEDLLHPAADRVIGKLFEAVTPAVFKLRSNKDKTFNLTAKQLIPDITTSTVTVARSFSFARQVLNLPFTPRLFVCPDRAGGLDHVAARPPASVCGGDILSGINPIDLTFIVARHLAYYRGEHYLCTLFDDPAEMETVLRAAKRLTGANLEDPEAERWAARIRGRVEPSERTLLGQIRERHPDLGNGGDLGRWLQAVELSACRAGLLLCNDLGIASRLIESDPRVRALGLTTAEVMGELLLFCVSEPYFRLREHLGIRIAEENGNA